MPNKKCIRYRWARMFFFHPRMKHVFRKTTRDYRSWCMNYEYSPMLLQSVCKYILLRDECVCECELRYRGHTATTFIITYRYGAWKCENKNKLQVLSITSVASARAKNENRNSGAAQKKSAWRQSINFMTIITLKLYIYHAIFCLTDTLLSCLFAVVIAASKCDQKQIEQKSSFAVCERARR